MRRRSIATGRIGKQRTRQRTVPPTGRTGKAWGGEAGIWRMAGEAHTEDGAAFGEICRAPQRKESLLQQVPDGEEGDDWVPECEAEREPDSGITRLQEKPREKEHGARIYKWKNKQGVVIKTKKW